MENNENIVIEKVTENVDGITTEESIPQGNEPEKVYTEEEFQEKLREGIKNGINEVMPGKIARNRARIEKQMNSEVGSLLNVLRAGSGMENASVKELAEAYSGFYEGNGVKIPQETNYSSQDIEILAQAEATDIINAGEDEVIEELERLSKLGVKDMTARDKAVFLNLNNYVKSTETSRELSKIGVPESVYNSQEYKDFASKFAGSNTSPKEIYEIYAKTQPKKEIQTMGSMTNSTSKDNGVKDFYTRDEASKFTVEDFNKNPALYEAVVKSMQKWK